MDYRSPQDITRGSSTLPGPVGAADAVHAHQADLNTQSAYGVNDLRYWGGRG